MTKPLDEMAVGLADEINAQVRIMGRKTPDWHRMAKRVLIIAASELRKRGHATTAAVVDQLREDNLPDIRMR